MQKRDFLMDLYRNSDQALRAIAAGATGNLVQISPLDIPAAVVVRSPNPGPRVAIFGGIHGDERCGVNALFQMVSEFSKGELSLDRGELVLAIGNEQALAENKRYLELNLNRLFGVSHEGMGDSYEVRRAFQLAGLLEGNDYFLDLHSTFRPTEPYIICGEKRIPEALEFGHSHVVIDWDKLGNQVIAGDTDSFSERLGACAFTVECGQHTDPKSSEQAYQSMRRFLEIAGLRAAVSESQKSETPKFIHALKVAVELTDQGFNYAPEIQAVNFETVYQGQTIGFTSDGPITAPFDATIVLPKDPARLKVGEELYLLAVTSRA